MLRSVRSGLVEAGVICRTPPSSIDVGGRDRRRRAIMAGHERDARAGHLFGDRARLLGIARIVADLELELWPSTPPAALMSATACSAPSLHLLAEGRLAAGHRPADRDLDSCAMRRRRRRAPKASAKAPSESLFMSVSHLPASDWRCATYTASVDFLARFRASRAGRCGHKAKDIAAPSGAPASRARRAAGDERRSRVRSNKPASDRSSPPNNA